MSPQLEAPQTFALTALRELAADALRPVASSDPDVVFTADALTPPAYMVGWDEPWLTPDGTSRHQARLLILAVSGRADPPVAVETLEAMVERAVTCLKATGYPFGLARVGAPRVFVISKLSYLGARIVVEPRVTLNP